MATERQKLYGPLVKEEHFWNVPLIMVLGSEEIKMLARVNSIIRPPMEILTMYRAKNPRRYTTLGLVNSYVISNHVVSQLIQKS